MEMINFFTLFFYYICNLIITSKTEIRYLDYFLKSLNLEYLLYYFLDSRHPLKEKLGYFRIVCHNFLKYKDIKVRPLVIGRQNRTKVMI